MNMQLRFIGMGLGTKIYNNVPSIKLSFHKTDYKRTSILIKKIEYFHS